MVVVKLIKVSLLAVFLISLPIVVVLLVLVIILVIIPIVLAIAPVLILNPISTPWAVARGGGGRRECHVVVWSFHCGHRCGCWHEVVVVEGKEVVAAGANLLFQ
jgi:hypothetical protein